MFRRRFRLVFSLLFATAIMFSHFASLSARSDQDSAFSAAPPRTLIRNASLMLTMDPNLGDGLLGQLENADILLEGDTIVAVGHNLNGEGARVIDATGKIVMPGFVDTHNHLWQSLIRGCAHDESLDEWLFQCVVPFRAASLPVSEQDAYNGVRYSTLDLIGTGVTTVVEVSHAFTPEFVRGSVRALTDSGLRFAYSYTGNSQPATIQHIRAVKEEFIDPNPLASLQVGSHPVPANFSNGNLQAMVALAKEFDVPLNVHLLEGASQRRDEPLKLLEQSGAFPDVQVIGNHGIHITDQEIADYLVKYDIRLTHNPLSNMRLASGFMRLHELHAAGVKVGLGLDGGSNDTSDFFNTMRIAVGIQRGRFMTADVYPSVPEVLRMATLGGAELLDMDDEIGSLTPGKKADLIIINPRAINFGRAMDLVAQLVFNGQPQNVEWVFVNGRALLADGKYVGVNPDKVIDAVEESMIKVKRELEPFLK
ncbi:MAG: amidohydrolase [Herpetosiphonaceae bacterium]|nr:MAG: amidohydrolase [Herpetosiphonaceae bacterium]